MKLAIIRCMQTEEICPGTKDFQIIREKKGAFEGVTEDIELIGFNSCGGCPGKKAVGRAKEMVKRGADTIAFASCLGKGAPIGFPCPYFEQIKEAVSKGVGENIKILDHTH